MANNQVDRYGNPIIVDPYNTVIDEDNIPLRQRGAIRAISGINAVDNPDTGTTDLSADIGEITLDGVIEGPADNTTFATNAVKTDLGATTAGMAVLTAADAAAQRTALGLGTAAVEAAGAFDAAGAAAAAQAASQPLDADLTTLAANITTAGQNMAAAANVAAQKALLAVTNTGSTPGRAGIPVLLDQQSLSAAATYASATFTANGYSKLIIEFVGKLSAFSYLQFQANGSATAVYEEHVILTQGVTPSAAGSAKGVLGWAQVGVGVANNAPFVSKIEFWPVTNGFARLGTAEAYSYGTDGLLNSGYLWDGRFAWDDTATDVTSISLSVTSATMTGIVYVYGIPV